MKSEIEEAEEEEEEKTYALIIRGIENKEDASYILEGIAEQIKEGYTSGMYGAYPWYFEEE